MCSSYQISVMITFPRNGNLKYEENKGSSVNWDTSVQKYADSVCFHSRKSISGMISHPPKITYSKKIE